MNLLVTGANGQLGMALRLLAGRLREWQLYFTDVDTLDILDKQAVASYIRSFDIDAVVNCAAYTAVDRAEEDAELCMRVNRDAVRNIGEVAASSGIRVIHVSTDYVFDGRATRPYREDDAPHPLSVYGQSKLAGEQALMVACPDAVIVRTAWLYSETGANFVKTMLRLGTERQPAEVHVVADQQGTPTYAGDLAGALLHILTSGKFTPGIYHYTNEGVCTWYDFAVRIFETAGLECRVNPLPTSGYPTRAPRPAYSVLDKTKIKQTYGLTIPPWEESLTGCLRHLQSTGAFPSNDSRHRDRPGNSPRPDDAFSGDSPCPGNAFSGNSPRPDDAFSGDSRPHPGNAFSGNSPRPGASDLNQLTEKKA